jgi:hypothetical protein
MSGPQVQDAIGHPGVFKTVQRWKDQGCPQRHARSILYRISGSRHKKLDSTLLSAVVNQDKKMTGE